MTTRPIEMRRSERRSLLLFMVGLLVLATGAAVFFTRSQANDGAVPVGISHVHGLGINPADGSLIVATHYGSFRLSEGSDDPRRISDSYQDTMGFTVAGPDHFLGSGHPDVPGRQQGQPARLGLIESTDGGLTWIALSLSGDVDFHGLAVAHGLIYGWDSGTGRFMVSTDKVQWETRSTLDLLGFGVDPDSADHVVGATPSGLVESSDGGRSWQPTAGPGLVVLSWAPDLGLWGADGQGVVWQRSESEWEQRGQLSGEPQALLVTERGLFAAAHDRDGVTGIYQSDDQGQTWQLRYRDPE